MNGPEGAPARGNSVRRTAVLFLSVYILLLAFFILLNSISTLHVIRAKAVMDSLATTFSTLLPNREAAFAGDHGNVAAAREYLKAVGAVFETAIPAVKVRIIQPGHLMQVSLPTEALFLPDKAEVRPGQGAFLNRLVAALNTAPGGLRYEMEFAIGHADEAEDGMPVGEDLSVGRVGALARELVSRGAPAGTVLVGLAPGDPRTARAVFRIIGEEPAAAQAGGSADR